MSYRTLVDMIPSGTTHSENRGPNSWDSEWMEQSYKSTQPSARNANREVGIGEVETVQDSLIPAVHAFFNNIAIRFGSNL